MGSGRTHRINVRLVAATHRDLTEMVRRKEFRSDLYYRLNVFPGSCCRRCESAARIFPSWLCILLRLFLRRMGKQIRIYRRKRSTRSPRILGRGTCAELQNLIERAVIMSNDGVLPNPAAATDHNPLTVSPAVPTTPQAAHSRTLREPSILQALRATGWVIGGPRGAADRLGLKRTT